MLGDLRPVDVTKMLVEGEFTPASNNLRNCEIEYADGPALEMNGLGNVIENCHMHDIDYSCTYKGGYTLNMIILFSLIIPFTSFFRTGIVGLERGNRKQCEDRDESK